MVPTSIRLAYAAPAFALAVVGIPIYVYLPKFYTDTVGVDVGLVGTLLLAARLLDAVTDPVVGRLSDRSETRWGRRRPWIALGSIPLALSVYLVFAPPSLDPGAAGAWLGAFLFALFLFWTAVVVPYESLGPEMTFDYDERTAVLGMRDGALILGTLVAAVSPALVGAVWSLAEGPDGEREKFLRVAQLYGPLLVVLCVLCARAVPEVSRQDREGAGRLELRSMLGNRPFVILLVAYTVSAFGSNLPATLILYYVEYVLGASNAEVFLLLYFVVGVAVLPAWVALSRRIGKKRAWIASMAVNTGAFVGVFFLGPGDVAAYAVLVALSGLGFGATVALPSAMQADVIDYDELRSGARREGQYLGVWSIARKLAAALGVGVALWVLGLSGYRPGVPQSESVVWTLRTLYAAVPSICNLVGLVIALRYPIEREHHEAIRLAVARRRAGEPCADPLRAGELRG